jgi:hypothetical protein
MTTTTTTTRNQTVTKLTEAENSANRAAANARFPDGEGETRPGGERLAAWITRPSGRKVRGRDLGKEVERAAYIAALARLEGTK